MGFLPLRERSGDPPLAIPPCLLGMLFVCVYPCLMTTRRGLKGVPTHLLALVSILVGCGGTDADELGVASTCEQTDNCPAVMIDGEEVQLSCLTQFDSGYCAIEGCNNATDCPMGSTCIAHEDGTNYCFRDCVDKAECNANRPPESAANCSSNFDYASSSDERNGVKACIPPSSG